MNYEKCIFKQGIRSAFIFLLSSFILLSAGASHREISIKWKVGDSPDGKMNLEWFQGDSIGFNLTSKMNREPFVFATNDVLVWEVRGWIGDHTNLYAVSTGTVVNAETGQSRYELTVEQTANLPEGTCLGYVKAMQLDGTNLSERVVLGWQWINVEWSETAQDYEITGALAKPYTTPGELAAIEAALSSELAVQSSGLATVSNAVADLTTEYTEHTEAQAATNEDVQSSIGTLQSEMSAAPNWTAAYAWGNHALAGYLTSYTETDPAFTAWDKSTGITITENQITDLQSYLTAESDPLWAASTNATETRFQTLETATNSLTAELGDLTTEYTEHTGNFQALEAVVVNYSNGWNSAFAWGNHALAGYLTSYTETDPLFVASTNATETRFQTLEGQTNLIQSALQSESDPLYLAWDKSTGITITESQIADLQSYLTSESDPAWHSGTGAIYSAIGTKQDAATAATDAELSAAVADSPNWTAAYAWGNHALAGYLTSYTEADPLFTAWDKDYGDLINTPTIPTQYTDAMAEAALAADLSSVTATQSTHTAQIASNATAVLSLAEAQSSQSNTIAGLDAELGDLTTEFTSHTNDVQRLETTIAENSNVWNSVTGKVDQTDSVYTQTVEKAAGAVPNTGEYGAIIIDAGEDSVTLRSNNNIDMDAGGTVTINCDTEIDGNTTANTLTLDSTIDEWSDIGLTYTNAVRQNAPIVITNDSTWTGWTTTGDLVGDDIFLDTDEYLLSPVQTNGIAEWEINQDGSGRISWSLSIETNGVTAQTYLPYHGTNGQVRITAGSPMPMMSEGMTVSSPVTLYGFQDADEAGTIKYVSGLRRIEAESHPDDLTRKSFVEGLIDGVKSWFTSKLAAYGDDPDKTLRGSQLRLGNMWVVSPADASGERWVCSGGEINGDGELVGTTNAFIISKNDYPLLSFTSGASGLSVPSKSFSLSGSDVTVSLFIATNGVASTPFAEWAESMTVNEWNRIQTYDSETYPTASAGTYELTFTLPLEDKMFFRAMQQQGESIMTVHVDRMDMGGCNLWMLDVETSNMVRLAVSNGTVVVIQE